MRQSHPMNPVPTADLDVFEAARRAVYDYVDPTNPDATGAQAVAKKIGMQPGTLYNKLNLTPHESMHHKLTMQDVVQILTVTGDLRVISALAHTFNCVCFPVPNMKNVSDTALLELVNKIGGEGGDFYRALNALLTGKRCKASQVAMLHKEGLEFIGAIVETMARSEGLVDAE